MKFKHEEQSLDLTINQLVIAGWTGRDRAAVDHHIEELAALGISPPSQVPLFYRVSHTLLTRDKHIQVLGDTSSGEVEPLLIKAQNQWWLGLASDHTDRELEAYSVAASKQACPKPVASTLWSLAAIQDHLDSLILRCEIKESGNWVTYQEGNLANIQPLQGLQELSGLTDDSAMLCGTLGAIGSVRPAADYRMSLEDPVLGRSIDLAYSVETLAIIQ